jgi:hypothetical protein
MKIFKLVRMVVPEDVFPHHTALAEYERELIRERTNAGLQSARAKRRTGGRPIEW